MKWTFEDAVNLVVDMFRNNEIGFNDLDRTAAELWQEMQNENGGDQSMEKIFEPIEITFDYPEKPETVSSDYTDYWESRCLDMGERVD